MQGGGKPQHRGGVSAWKGVGCVGFGFRQLSATVQGRFFVWVARTLRANSCKEFARSCIYDGLWRLTNGMPSAVSVRIR